MSTKAATIGAEYFAAWSTGQVDKAIEHVTDNVEIIAPNGTFHGHAGYHDFMDGFVRMLTGVSEFTIFGDDTTAVAWYATHLQPVPTLVAGERITLDGDKIARIEITFDQMPLAQAFGGKAPAHDTLTDPSA
jgi:SnoaL-like domain